MLDYTLPAGQLAEVRVALRRTRDECVADRIEPVMLLATGWTAEQVGEVLLIRPYAVHSHFKPYRHGRGLPGLLQVEFRDAGATLHTGTPGREIRKRSMCVDQLEVFPCNLSIPVP